MTLERLSSASASGVLLSRLPLADRGWRYADHGSELYLRKRAGSQSLNQSTWLEICNAPAHASSCPPSSTKLVLSFTVALSACFGAAS